MREEGHIEGQTMNKELKDSRIEADQTSGNDVPPIQAHQGPAMPQDRDKDTKVNDVKKPSASPFEPGTVADEPGVSAQKREANRKNAQKSTGPRTEAGKAKSALNSYRHGFFAKHLFPTAEQAAEDKSDYLAVAKGVYDHYQPSGFMENFWVEKIATEAVRLARLVGYEQREMMAWRSPFWGSAAGSILRYQTTANRRLREAIEELERLQTKRKAEASENLLRPEAGDTDVEPEASTPTV